MPLDTAAGLKHVALVPRLSPIKQPDYHKYDRDDRQQMQHPMEDPFEDHEYEPQYEESDTDDQQQCTHFKILRLL
jgi:hypothetical protein